VEKVAEKLVFCYFQKMNLEAGWPHVFVKKSTKMYPNEYYVKIKILFFQGNGTQNFGFVCNFQKLPKVNNSPKKRKLAQSGHPVRLSAALSRLDPNRII
jgi:hypothetical protein